MSYDDICILCQGEYANNMRNGLGVFRYSNGNVYEGQWENDKKHGLGVYRDKIKKEIYEGDWIQGKKAIGVYTDMNDGQ
jgi:hypothetical protein